MRFASDGCPCDQPSGCCERMPSVEARAEAAKAELRDKTMQADARAELLGAAEAEVERLTLDFAAFRETARELETALRHQRVEAQEKVERLKAENAAIQEQHARILAWPPVDVIAAESVIARAAALQARLGAGGKPLMAALDDLKAYRSKQAAEIDALTRERDEARAKATQAQTEAVYVEMRECWRLEREYGAEANRLLERAISGKHDDSCAGHIGRDYSRCNCYQSTLKSDIRAHLARTGTVEDGLHPQTACLVDRFTVALKQKLRAAEIKHGYGDHWLAADWMDQCRQQLLLHLAKGDPLDVAAYCAFLWHHGEPTAGRYLARTGGKLNPCDKDDCPVCDEQA